MQEMYVTVGETVQVVDMPERSASVLSDVRWGAFDHLLSPAFWYGQIRQAEMLGLEERYRLGNNLLEEASACILGGFGFSAEIGLAAFGALRDRGMLRPETSAAEIEDLLRQPLVVGGSRRRYRFPKQKARYVMSAIRSLSDVDLEHLTDLELRDHLVRIDGVGLKTASWIVRNHRASDDVAIVDIHLVYACRAMGLVSDVVLPRDYLFIERRFLDLCTSMGVSAAVLDSLIWRHVRVLKPVIERHRIDGIASADHGDPAGMDTGPYGDSVQ